MASVSADSSSSPTASSFLANYTVSTNSTTITIFYGLTDGGTTAASWSNSINVGVKNIGIFSLTVSNLLDERIYCWNVRGVDGGGTAWGVTKNQGTTGKVVCCEARCGAVAESGVRTRYLTTDPHTFDLRWGEGIVRKSLIAAHFSSTVVIPIYAVSQASIHSTVDQGASAVFGGVFTTTAYNFTSTDGRTSAYSTNGSAPNIGYNGNPNWPTTPAAVGGTTPVDRQFWILRKGSWKIDLSVYINPGLLNSSGGSGSYIVNLTQAPYANNRGNRTTLFGNANTIFYTYTHPGGTDTRTVKTFLRGTGWWRIYLNIPLQNNPSVPTNQRLFEITMTLTRAV